jgi:hypothetical protein
MREATECKGCINCQPNIIASYKLSNEWSYPFDYECLFSEHFFPILADQCPNYHTELEFADKRPLNYRSLINPLIYSQILF